MPSDDYWFNERYEAMFYAEHGHFDWQEDEYCQHCIEQRGTAAEAVESVRRLSNEELREEIRKRR